MTDYFAYREEFAARNRQSALAAAQKTAADARRALRTPAIPKHLRHALRLRAENPTLSLPDLAGLAGLTKDQMVGRIRRGLAFADRPRSPGPGGSST